jgi:SNF2 family DNA or RNA helicase
MADMINNVNAQLKTQLLDYQEDGLHWMYERETTVFQLQGEDMPRGGIVADDVGLGKTLMAIAIMIANPKKKTLIILPKTLVFQWKAQIEKFTSFHTEVLTSNTSDFESKVSKNTVYLISQSQLNKRNSEVGKTGVHLIEWDRIIVDEAHFLRNKKSKTYDAFMLLQSDIRWALTATPVMNRMTDFVHIMQWIGVSQFFCQTEKAIVNDAFILRRTKDDLSIEQRLECHTNIKYIPFSCFEEAKLYTTIYNQERNVIKNNQNRNISDLLEHLLRIRQICIHPQLYLDGMTKKKKESFGSWSHSVTKLDHLLQSIQSHDDPADKTLVFCAFVKEIDITVDFLKSNHYDCERLDGKMTMAERNDAVERFSTLPGKRVFVIQINTGGQGINLQCANRIYIMSPDWNPAVEHQAVGRAYRKGQTKTVYVTKFCISSGVPERPSVEENIIKLQYEKKRIIANVLNDRRIEQDGIVHDKKSLGMCKENIKKLFNIYM